MKTVSQDLGGSIGRTNLKLFVRRLRATDGQVLEHYQAWRLRKLRVPLFAMAWQTCHTHEDYCALRVEAQGRGEAIVTPFWDTNQAVPPGTRRASLGSRVAPYIYPK